MTQLKAEAVKEQAAFPASLPPQRGRPGRGRLATGAVVVAVAAAAATGVRIVGSRELLWGVEAALVAITSVYLAAVGFRLFVVFCGMTTATRLAVHDSLPDEKLPLYTVLVPLTDADTASDLVADLRALDYPAGRLQVLLLVGDRGWRPDAGLPDHFEIVNAGASTRTEAYAAGLARARGELCVGYEPGQRPDPGQLRAAASAFGELPAWVVCVRPETRCQNPDANALTQYVAAENAVTSALFLRGLDRFGLPLPAGGPSCHFRADALRRLGAWQESDGAEGADIGIRIARRGWSVGRLASVTSEEPDGRLGQWLRRRSAEIRDDYRTWLAHIRSPYRLWRDLGPIRFAALQLTMALPGLTALVSPLFWLLTVAWLAGGLGSIAKVFPLWELQAVIAAMLLANLMTAYALMVGCMEHGLFGAVRTMLLAPVYWALTSVAAYWALLPRDRRQSGPAVVPSVAAS